MYDFGLRLDRTDFKHLEPSVAYGTPPRKIHGGMDHQKFETGSWPPQVASITGIPEAVAAIC